MATPSPAKRLRQLTEQIPDDAVVWDLLQNLESDSNQWADHIIALTGATYVDKALEVALKSKFIALSPSEAKAIFSYEKRGPLSDFSAKIKIAYALDIVGPVTRNDLERIRAIRNAFAHSLTPIGFMTKEVSEICEAISVHKSTGLLSRWAYGDTPRAIYINSTLTIASRLKEGLKTFVAMMMGRAFPVPLLP